MAVKKILLALTVLCLILADQFLYAQPLLYAALQKGADSKVAWEKVDNVILAARFNSFDTLSIYALARKMKAPVLLVKDQVEDSSEVFTYIQNRLVPGGHIYLLGSVDIPSFSQRLLQMGFSTWQIHHIGGLNRPETTLLIAQSGKGQIIATTPTLLLANAAKYLTIPTYDGSGESAHPSIIDFKTEYNLEQWNGYRYWMASTPYPKGNSIFENPSLVVSNDGQNWIVPPGMNNPLENTPNHILNPKLRNYNSDPELVYDPDTRLLNLYWREFLMNYYDRIWRIKINPDLRLDPKELCLEERGFDGEGLALSPTIWRKGKNEWYMWTTNGYSLIHLYTSNDGTNWSNRQRCNTPWYTWNGGYTPWHVEAKPNYPENRVEFFINGWSNHALRRNQLLFYAEVSMDNLTHFKMPLANAILARGSKNNWDDEMIYRTTFTIERGPSAYKYRVWYSALSKTISWHIGYTEGQLGTNFTLNQTDHRYDSASR